MHMSPSELGEGPYTLSTVAFNDTMLGGNLTSGEVFPLPKASTSGGLGEVVFNFMITAGLHKDRFSRESQCSVHTPFFPLPSVSLSFPSLSLSFPRHPSPSLYLPELPSFFFPPYLSTSHCISSSLSKKWRPPLHVVQHQDLSHVKFNRPEKGSEVPAS